MSGDGHDYHGWPNYETWLTYTWLSNDLYTDSACDALATQAHSEVAAADTLEDFVQERLPALDEAGLSADLLRASLRHVDWQRLARAYRTRR